MNGLTRSLVALGAVLALAGTAQAAGRLVVYCSMQPFWCDAAAAEYSKKYNVRVDLVRTGSGSAFAKILAEKDNPQADVWYGGTMDPHAQAGTVGLLESYRSPMLPELGEAFRNPATTKQYHTVGIYAGVLGFSINTKILAQMRLPEPACWEDLTKPEYKGLVQIASPQSSGTAYTALATFVQLWGEEKAYAYLKRMHLNVNQYTKSGSAPGKAAARGEAVIGIGFLHDHALEIVEGFPLKLVVPCEGTGYEIGGLSIIKGARNLANAKLFVDWALSKEGQEVGGSVKAFQVPTNLKAAVPKEAIRLEAVKLIDYDFVKYGADEVRNHLIARWAREVAPIAR